MKKLPKYLYRKDDSARLTLHSDDKYVFDHSLMHKPYRYDYELLMGAPRNKGFFTTNLSECQTPEEYSIKMDEMCKNDGHGNGDFD